MIAAAAGLFFIFRWGWLPFCPRSMLNCCWCCRIDCTKNGCHCSKVGYVFTFCIICCALSVWDSDDLSAENSCLSRVITYWQVSHLRLMILLWWVSSQSLISGFKLLLLIYNGISVCMCVCTCVHACLHTHACACNPHLCLCLCMSKI